jgi:hypothetical protein
MNWLGSTFSQEPNTNSSAIRYSWFCKAVSISLANRSCFFHLRTKISRIKSTNIEFVGAGFLGSGSLIFDHIINPSISASNKTWFGGTTVDTNCIIPKALFGKRSDLIIEVWSENELPSNINWLQLMQWKGENPKNLIHSEIEMGLQHAQQFLQTTALLEKYR